MNTCIKNKWDWGRGGVVGMGGRGEVGGMGSGKRKREKRETVHYETLSIFHAF